MRTFLHSGGCGDVIYSLVTIKAMGGGIVYVKKRNDYNSTCNNFEALKDLLMQQEYIADVREYDAGYDFHKYDPAIDIDVDLDYFRVQPRLAQKHLILSHLHAQQANVVDWTQPWLRIKGRLHEWFYRNYCVINRTERYQDPKFDWRPVMAEAAKNHDYILFIGFEREYKAFLDQVDVNGKMIHLPTNNLLHVARAVDYADHVYCNQSAVLTIAQGLGVNYSLEVAPGHTNCIMHTKNETLLNR